MMTKSFENDSDTNHGLNSQRKPEDASFMREAIRLSQLAVEHGNEPFGAVLVKNGEIVFTNENQIYTRHDPTFQPCFMCSGAMVWVKLGRLVYGASNSDLEAILGNEGCNCSKIVFDNSFWQPQVTAGILRDESLMILKDYFDTHAKG